MTKQALEGVKVLDLTRIWAGPLGTRALADMGAEVIRVEDVRSRTGANLVPVFPDGDPGEDPWNRSGPFNEYHRNKKSVTLNLKNARGRELFLALVAVSDVVVENYSALAMRKFDLTYPVLAEANPGIIMVSASGFGADGPYHTYKSYGTISEAFCGMWGMHGYEGDGPLMLGINYSDPAVAMNIAAAVTLALFQRSRTGVGQWIDLGQCEALAGLIGHAYVAYGMNGAQPPRRGNRKPGSAPHGAYPCRGDDAWVAIAVRGDTEWRSFCSALGDPAWTREERFASQASREQHSEALDKLVGEWTRSRDAHEVMQLLQESGVAAAPVQTVPEMLEDPHLKERGFWWDVSHPREGTYPQQRLPQRFSKTPVELRRHAPLLGEHNREVLGGLLGVSDGELDALEAQGLIGSAPPAR